MSLYLGDERIVEVKTVVNADKIVFDGAYNAETNPAATVQTVNALEAGLDAGNVQPKYAKQISTSNSHGMSLYESHMRGFDLEDGIYIVYMTIFKGDKIYGSSGILNVERLNGNIKGSTLLATEDEIIRMDIVLENNEKQIRLYKRLSSGYTAYTVQSANITFLKIGESLI